MRVILLHNPAAGHLGRPTPTAGELVEAIVAVGHEVSYYSTRDPAWKAALHLEADLVAVAGGDGSVSKVLRRLAGRGVPATILPLGAANNVASAVGIRGEPRELIPRWSAFRARRFDLGVACGLRRGKERRFVEGVGGGLFTELLHALDRRAPGLNAAIEQHEGLAGYVRLLREMLARRDAVPWRIEIDGTDATGRYLLIEVMNVGLVGPSLPLAPRADPGDGLLDVVLVDEAQRACLEAFLDARAEGCAAPELPVRRARQVVLGSRQALLRVDDKVRDAARTEDVALRVEAGALRLLAPP
ncbi:MAG TPA: diacylglycerol kinase family protein [Longimicrobiales bacterium]|nr:diacylglycerol kinase family protein [Longimicrobiales bacterium]